MKYAKIQAFSDAVDISSYIDRTASVFSRIWTESRIYGEIWIRFCQNTRKYEPEKSPFLTCFTQCVPYKFIMGHKGQNFTETRCCGFFVLKSWCRGFSVLESVYGGFLSSGKCFGIAMSWLNCLCFSMSWCFSPRI